MSKKRSFRRIGEGEVDPSEAEITSSRKTMVDHIESLKPNELSELAQGLFGIIMIQELEEIITAVIAIDAQPDRIKDEQKAGVERACTLIKKMLIPTMAEAEYQELLKKYRRAANLYEKMEDLQAKSEQN